ncbi:MAG: cyclase family protein, partial [Acidimicrobiales bacterium]|nr:cyclase family protein [Acidimicrobiales bacterium]
MLSSPSPLDGDIGTRGEKLSGFVGYNGKVPVPVSEKIPESFRNVAAQVSNWGRWGPDDRLGTLNLVDPAARQRGVAAVRQGRAFSLGLPLSEEEGIQVGFVPGRVNPTRTMICVNEPLSDDPTWISSSEDVVTLALQCATHWDGLAHVSYGAAPEGRRLYNGYPASSVDRGGSAALGIHHVRTLVSRGVLLDVARAKGLEVLEPGYPITPADLDAACELGNLEVEPGMSGGPAFDPADGDVFGMVDAKLDNQKIGIAVSMGNLIIAYLQGRGVAIVIGSSAPARSTAGPQAPAPPLTAGDQRQVAMQRLFFQENYAAAGSMAADYLLEHPDDLVANGVIVSTIRALFLNKYE